MVKKKTKQHIKLKQETSLLKSSLLFIFDPAIEA
jgi:hypothetical protein